MFFIYLYIAILGLILGSFYNVVGIRIPEGESVISPPSHCPSCQKRLKPLELIPVFSFILQRGKCKHCKEKISPFYPFFEGLTAILFIISFYLIGFNQELIIAWLFVSLLVIITISDLKYQIISDKVLLFFAIVIGGLRLWISLDPWYDAFLGAIFGFGLLLLIAVLSRGGMGGGDIKLFGVIGLVLGFKGTLTTLIVATFLGTIVGLGLMWLGKVRKGVPFAFGPFIAVAAIAAYFFGDNIIKWYVNTFFL
ncbi:prepilin peptidase [Bacillaceae bacterium W0354]